jgi:hypothetical protein
VHLTPQLDVSENEPREEAVDAVAEAEPAVLEAVATEPEPEPEPGPAAAEPEPAGEEPPAAE